ncbi:hypothetical protein A2Z33_01730 [Candidatus Gottesmanbacteria bacterium RBG_16_52_11]|uniref:Major facilitator superfamily (MFS) profile domain-containing protein n=1 Tax=Candidatus Gottesmanbacteria bacterium RBG_16_52_11 TaxID=1798374 RepID=A0A1F5YNY6_9BACT|nr:MAG: hypothetical protein A2Z33_01730 [Candidatus Gottesmanbacteria bacterium RBG_16_52_11]
MRVRNPVHLVIALVAVVNALGYGIIIPVMYIYTRRFGLTDFQIGMLFATYSVFQFLATPLIGRLSDRYGRKPLLVISITGTAVSFLMMALAHNALLLFLSRALDGVTAGNIPVASAVISDTTSLKDRARGFGIIGAAFGFGFVFGPAISAASVGFGLAIPFFIAAAVSAAAALITFVILPETNTHTGEAAAGKLIDIGRLVRSVLDPQIGVTLLLSLIYSVAFTLYTYVYQPYAVKVISMTPAQISLNFTVFGIVGLVTQLLIIPAVSRRLGERRALTGALTVAVTTFLWLSVTRSFGLFVLASVFQALANGFVNPLVQAILSREADAKSQGSVLGLNASYISIGMIIGPVLGGLVAMYGLPLPFLAGSIMVGICAFLSLRIPQSIRIRQSAF